MNIKTVKDNAALVAGIVLPLLLVLVVWGSQKIAEMAVPDPAYSLVYVKFDNYTSRAVTNVNAKDDRIVASVKKRNDDYPSKYRNKATLIYVNPVTGEKKTAVMEFPENTGDNEFQDVAVPEPFASMTVLNPDKAPDGYTVHDAAYYNKSGIAREVFGGSYQGKLVIAKNGRNIVVDTHDTYSYNLQILGWVKP